MLCIYKSLHADGIPLKFGPVRKNIPYSQKYWQELNLAVEPQIAITRILANLSLAVRYGITIRIYASKKFWRL